MRATHPFTMTSRDPFPMTSPEAQQLAASTNSDVTATSTSSSDGAGTAWASMATVPSAARRSSSSEIAADDAADHNDDEIPTSAATLTQEQELLPTKRDTQLYPYDFYDNTKKLPQEEEEDVFLDRPLWESRSRHPWLVQSLRAMERLYIWLYGKDLALTEFVRTLHLASTLFFMIGGYWLLRSLKDPVLTALCGVEVIPKAKMLSVFVVLGVVSIYNHLLDHPRLRKHHLFYLFGSFYFVAFTVIAILLRHPTIGLPNQQHSPHRLLGWISYCTIESFGSVMVSLFWSFTNSNVNVTTAKAAYGIMVAAAQVGSILGPTVVSMYANVIGVASCYMIGACAMLLLQVTMYSYIATYGTLSEARTWDWRQRASYSFLV
jgi:hypothetical protein